MLKWSDHSAVSRQGMINFKETSDCSRVNERMEKAALFVAFSLSALNPKTALKISKKLRKKAAMNDYCDILWLH